MAPTVLFVPGFWEGPTVFAEVASLLRQPISTTASGFPIETVSLVSTGTSSPGNPTLNDDTAAVRVCLTSLVEEAGKEVLLVVHSAGGIVGPNAMEGLAVKGRKAQGLKGGVVGIVFLAAGVAPEGYEPQPLPFFEIKDNALYCANTRQALFSDLDDTEAERWMSVLQHQPAEGWARAVTYCGWRNVSNTYLICEGDKLLPVALQEQFAELAGAKVERCSAGHMCMLTAKKKVVEVIRGAIDRA